MLEGHVLNERYRILNAIGGGGMANVYLARDMILDRDVAIKVLRLEYANDEEFIARFDREAQSATSLSHPNIVNIYDVGEEDHILYMVMEYIDGMTLKEYIQKNNPVPVEQALDIMKQISRAIAHAHANGLIHRDIKPQNILINAFGQVKVTDFGIALALSATSLTQTNSIVGSVHYLSPEQARGGGATKKSDIYALGIVMYELLTGTIPFSGQSPIAVALQHLQHDIPSIRELRSEIPQSVENIVLKATAKNPMNRYASVYEVDDALESALEPNKLNEQKYLPPVEDGEDTKAIPIITEGLYDDAAFDDTIIHKTNSPTTEPSPQEKANDIVEQPPLKPKPALKKRRKWLIVLIILSVLALAGLAALFIFPQLFKTKDVKIPDLVNLEYEEAVEKLDKLKLKAERTFVNSEDVDEGLIVKTDPTKSRTVKENSTVKLYVSEGKEKKEISDYTEQQFDVAEKALKELGYEEVIAYERFSDQPVGEILEQVQPLPGTKVIPSETSVIFEVSGGPELTSLNNLKGMTRDEANSYLENHSFHMNEEAEYSDIVPEGTVIRQEPAAETKLSKGAAVKVIISKGPEKEPVNSDATFVVPYVLPAGDDPKDPSDIDVEIYIGDMKHDINEVYKDDEINKDKEYTITLKIEPGETARYKVVREGEVIIDETVPYEEVNE